MEFFKTNKDLMMAVTDSFGVDPMLLLSISGMESNHGSIHGVFPVFSAPALRAIKKAKQSGLKLNKFDGIRLAFVEYQIRNDIVRRLKLTANIYFYAFLYLIVRALSVPLKKRIWCFR